uniref:Transposase n=1 Tax=Ascaris lumbricoides TaxID=6252 RepID=A0A0M3IT27_ASCLU
MHNARCGAIVANAVIAYETSTNRWRANVQNRSTTQTRARDIVHNASRIPSKLCTDIG